MRLVPYFSWIFRFIGRKTSYSACKLQEWYKAPLMFTAEMYASIVRTYALTIFYGPMAPLVYFVGVISMVVNYTTSKYAMFHYYKVPVRMNDELCEGLREILAILMIGHIVVAGFSYSQACEEPGVPRVAAGPRLRRRVRLLSRRALQVYEVPDAVPDGRDRHGRLRPRLAPHLADGRRRDLGGNLRYDQRVAKMDAEAVKGHGTIRSSTTSELGAPSARRTSRSRTKSSSTASSQIDFTPEFHHILPPRADGRQREERQPAEQAGRRHRGGLRVARGRVDI